MKILTVFVFASLIALAGCEEDGPAERAGEKIDQTAEDIGNQIEDTCESVKENMGAQDQDC